MEKIEELVDEIRQLENNFAKALAGNEGHAVLRGIWKKIQELRDQFKLHMDELSSKKNSAANHFRAKN